MRQMLCYTGVLIPLTLLPVSFGALGWLYGAGAVLLDAALLLGVIRVARQQRWSAAAWSLYKFSLLYLALLFAAMVVDRALLR
jgi:protoheme IX farnesyltransferase